MLSGVLENRMPEESTGTEVWSTGGERMRVRDGAAAVVVEETRWHAASSARTPVSGVLAGCASEAGALECVRIKLQRALEAIDARLAELRG